jgi:hypothetical protein
LGNKAANKAKNVASDLSDLPNPFKGNTDPQNLANDAKNKAWHPHDFLAFLCVSCQELLTLPREDLSQLHWSGDPCIDPCQI